MLRLPNKSLVLAAFVGTLAACTVNVHDHDGPEPVPQSNHARLKIPPGHFPPQGKCRIWIPGTPPGHQPKARTCHEIDRHAPAGAWVLYRPKTNRRLLYVREVDPHKSGVIIRVRMYDVSSGKYLGEAGDRD